MPKSRYKFYVYLAPDFCERAEFFGLTNASFRLHLCALGWMASQGGTNFIPASRVPRLVPRFAGVGQLVDLRWWQPVEGGYSINHGCVRSLHGDHAGHPLWKVARSIENRQAIPKKIRAEVYLRDGHKCLQCGSVDDLTLDHIHPYSLGGLDEVDNLRTLCRSCNSRKGAKV